MWKNSTKLDNWLQFPPPLERVVKPERFLERFVLQLRGKMGALQLLQDSLEQLLNIRSMGPQNM